MQDGAAPMSVQIEVAAAFFGYLLLVVGIGVWSSRRSSGGLSEFFLGGRQLGRYVVALSAVVSGRSAWLLLGFAGLAYTRGVTAIWMAVGYVVVEGVLFLSYAVRLRRFSERYDCLTVPDFFAARFGGRAPWLRTILVATILLFLVTYIGAQLKGGGKTLAPAFGIGEGTAVLLTAAIVLGYTMLGGFLAVSLTDLLQAVVMIVALIGLPLVAGHALGGFGAVFDQLRQVDPTLVDPTAIGAGALIGFLGIGLGSPGQPHIISRYMAIKDPRDLRVAALVGTVWNALMAAGALFVGLVGRAWFASSDALPGGDPEKIYLVLAQAELSPVLFGVIVASVFAAIMSTADSQVLVAASCVVRDLYQKVLRRDEEIEPRRLVALSRAVVVFVVLLALALGYGAEDQIVWFVLVAWAGLGAALGPTSILALYWRRTTAPGIVAGILAGAGVTLFWRLTPALKAEMYELVPGFAAGLLACVTVSLATRPPPGLDDAFATMAGEDRAATPGPPRSA